MRCNGSDSIQCQAVTQYSVRAVNHFSVRAVTQCSVRALTQYSVRAVTQYSVRAVLQYSVRAVTQCSNRIARYNLGPGASTAVSYTPLRTLTGTTLHCTLIHFMEIQCMEVHHSVLKNSIMQCSVVEPLPLICCQRCYPSWQGYQASLLQLLHSTTLRLHLEIVFEAYELMSHVSPCIKYV